MAWHSKWSICDVCTAVWLSTQGKAKRLGVCVTAANKIDSYTAPLNAWWVPPARWPATVFDDPHTALIAATVPPGQRSCRSKERWCGFIIRSCWEHILIVNSLLLVVVVNIHCQSLEALTDTASRPSHAWGTPRKTDFSVFRDCQLAL